MSKIRLYGETSGFIELSAPDTAADNTVDLGLIPTVDTAPSDGQVLAWNASTGKWEPTTMTVKEKKIAAFTASGTWTVPAGVTYAIAHMKGGGGGIGSASSGAGGTSSVAFAGGTVSALGGNPVDAGSMTLRAAGDAGQNNSGQGARYFAQGDGSVISANAAIGQSGLDGSSIVAGDSVTPAASITVTVGAGGAAGTGGAAGGSGYVYIEYYE